MKAKFNNLVLFVSLSSFYSFLESTEISKISGSVQCLMIYSFLKIKQKLSSGNPLFFMGNEVGLRFLLLSPNPLPLSIIFLTRAM